MFGLFHANTIIQRIRCTNFAQNGKASLPRHQKFGDDLAMMIITADEFARMERLLADLLPECDAGQEAALLQLHTRLQAIFAEQSGLNASRDRLTALRHGTET
jgi:hypothetical protein